MTTNTENNTRINIMREQAENIACSERIQESVENEALYYDAKSDFEYFEDVLKIKNNTDRENKIKQLIKDGVDINATKDSKTILDIAIEKRCSSEIIRSLLSNGSKINTIDANSCTVLHRSVKNKNRKIVEVLLEANKKEMSQYLLAKLVPSFILCHKIEVNAKDNDNFTALDYAQHGSEMYSLLQKYGAKHSEKFLYLRSLNIEELDLNKLVSDNDYCFDIFTKALEIEDQYKKAKVIGWLLENGANINVIKDNQTLLGIAAAKGDIENAVLLLKGGASGEINSQDAEGRTLLLNAIIQDNLDVAEYLIKQGVNVNILDNNGNSLLHYAIDGFSKSIFTTIRKCGEVFTADAVFDLLLENGANLYAKNLDGLTAFEYAFCTRMAPEKVAYLFKIYVEKGDQSKNTQLVKDFRLPSGETLLEYFFNNKLFDSAQSCRDLGVNVNQLQNRADITNNVNTSNNKKNGKLYFQVAIGCIAMFSLGMGAAATFILIKMSPLALAIVATIFSVIAIVAVALFMLYKKVKVDKAIVDNPTSNISLEETANDLFNVLSTVAEKGAEAGALYLEVKEKVESVAERITFKQELIATRFQNIQENFVNKLKNFEELQDARDSGHLKKFYATVKDVLKIRSNIPISNLHLLSFAYHLSLEVSYAIFQTITDPTLVSTILTAISERRLPEDKQWAKVLKNTVPNLIRNQEIMRNIIVPTLTDILKSLSESKEERKFIIYTLVCLKEMINEVYTTSVQESLRIISGVELANSLNGTVQAINNLLNCYGHEEVERAKIANELDYRVGKLTPEQTEQFVRELGERVGPLREFEGQVTNKQSISKLVDYCLDPKLNDKETAATLLGYMHTYTEGLAAEAGNLSNIVLVTHVGANRYTQQG